CQHLGGWRLRLLVEAEAAHAHAEPADFDVNVGAGGQRFDRCGPTRKNLLVLAGIGADADLAAHVIEHDLRLREGARDTAKRVDRRMVEPGNEGEAKSAEDRETFAKFAVAQETARRAVGRIEDRVVGVPGAGVADAAEATAAGTNMRGQHRLDATAQRAIRMAHNPRPMAASPPQSSPQPLAAPP